MKCSALYKILEKSSFSSLHTRSGSGHQGKFDPHSSHMADDVLTKFLQAPLSGDLADVPGIGEKNKEHFMNLSKETDGKFQNIPNSWKLMGEYLKLKEDGMSGVDLCNKFWHFESLELIVSCPLFVPLLRSVI